MISSLRAPWLAHNSRRVRAIVVLLASAGALSCSSPTKPTPVTSPPTLTCPAPQTIVSPNNLPVSVVYPKPTLTGGAAPVISACTPDVGALFPPGTSQVTCTSTDAQSRTASCAFPVTVQPALRLNASTVLAFGDSITEGKTAAGLLPFALTGVGCPNPDRATSYPHVLGSSLVTAYPTQAVPVTNCGFGGETAVEGVTRLPTALVLAPYDVLLLMEGANDLNEVALSGGTSSVAVERIAGAVTAMIRNSRNGRTIFVGTLPPERAGGRAARPDWVVPVNNRLRTLVPAEGAVLVDVYQALGSSPDPYIDSDGLHPTISGYQKIAEAFFGAIRLRLETQSAPR